MVPSVECFSAYAACRLGIWICCSRGFPGLLKGLLEVPPAALGILTRLDRCWWVTWSVDQGSGGISSSSEENLPCNKATRSARVDLNRGFCPAGMIFWGTAATCHCSNQWPCEGSKAWLASSGEHSVRHGTAQPSSAHLRLGEARPAEDV